MVNNQIQVGGPNDCPAITTTTTTSDYVLQEYGWICPKCGRVYSPSTTMCLYCAGDNNGMTYTTSNKTFPDDYYIDTFHLDPDWFINYNKPGYTYTYNRKEES